MRNLGRFAIAHLQQAWQRKLVTNFFIFVVLLISFSVLNLGLLVANNFQNMTQNWGDKIEMNVYLKSEQDGSALRAEVEKNPLVAAVKAISQGDAVKELQAQVATMAPDLLKDQSLFQFIPASLQLELKAGNDAVGLLQAAQALAGELKTKPEVDDVQYGQALLSQFQSVVKVARRIGYGFLLTIVAGATFMVLFIVRNSLQQRREEIEILELVGASRAMIRLPVLMEGVLFAGVAGGVSLLLSAWMFNLICAVLSREDLFFYVAHELKFFNPDQSAFLILSYALVGAVASILCIRQLNSGYAAAEKLLADGGE